MTHKHCTLVFGSHYGWFYNDNFLWQPFKEWEITKWWDEWMPCGGGILKTKHSCITMQHVYSDDQFLVLSRWSYY